MTKTDSIFSKRMAATSTHLDFTLTRKDSTQLVARTTKRDITFSLSCMRDSMAKILKTTA